MLTRENLDNPQPHVIINGSAKSGLAVDRDYRRLSRKNRLRTLGRRPQGGNGYSFGCC